ncbi:MAG: TrkA family potassium uptake protein [Gloeobacterales cyanobacterium]
MELSFKNWFKTNQRHQFVVIGLGRFGTAVARTLHQLGYEVLALDNDPERVRQAAGEDLATQVLQADATDPEALRQVGIREFGVVVVAIGSALEQSILATLNAKSLGVAHVVAKAISPIQGTVLQKVGADRVVYPESDMGRNVALSLTSDGILESLQLDNEHSIVEVCAPEEFAGISLQELNLRHRYGVNILAIRHGDKFNINPGPKDFMQTGDVIVIIGANRDLDRLPRATASKP